MFIKSTVPAVATTTAIMLSSLPTAEKLALGMTLVTAANAVLRPNKGAMAAFSGSVVPLHITGFDPATTLYLYASSVAVFLTAKNKDKIPVGISIVAASLINIQLVNGAAMNWVNQQEDECLAIWKNPDPDHMGKQPYQMQLVCNAYREMYKNRALPQPLESRIPR